MLTSFAKAIEVQVNALLRRVLPRIPAPARRVNRDGRTVDLKDALPLPLGDLSRAIGGERALHAALAQGVDHGVWFTGSFPALLDDFVMVRNAATHETRVDRQTAAYWRGRLIGVGCAGVLVELAKVRPKVP